MLEIVVTSNSPGEVAAWVKPAVKKLKEYYPESRISVFLPPCVFASGSEKKVLLDFPEVDLVFDKNEYLKYILLGKKPEGFKPVKRGIVIFLGGDLMHAVFLGKKLNYPVVAYTEGVYNSSKKIERFIVPDHRTRRKVSRKVSGKGRVEVIGNLMLDAIETKMDREEAFNFFNIGKKDRVITLFPGSRPKEVEYMLPFFLKSIPALVTCDNNLKFFLGCSPFISMDKLEDIYYNYLENNGLKGDFFREGDRYIIKLEEGTEIVVYSEYQYDLMQVTDLALTIPGTNNMELAFFGTPMVVILPLNEPERIPLEGLIGLAGRVPLLGPALMRSVVPKIAEKMRFVALINRVAGEELVPEIRGVINPIDLVIQVEELIRNDSKLEKMSEKIKKAAGSKGAAENLIKVVDQVLASYHQSRL